MGKKERDGIHKFLSVWQSENPEGRLFRANSGMGWAGRVVGDQTRDSWRSVTIAGARPFHGMPEGTPDLIGWTQVKITPEMVGQKVAVFTGYEFKTIGTKATIKQKVFIERLKVSGGIAEIVTIPDK